MSQRLILSFMAVKTGSPISKPILLKLADNADSHGVCFPSCDYLAQYCKISLCTVKSHLKTLEQDGFIKRIQRFDKKDVREAICTNCEHRIIAMLNKATATRRRGKKSHSPRGSELYP